MNLRSNNISADYYPPKSQQTYLLKFSSKNPKDRKMSWEYVELCIIWQSLTTPPFQVIKLILWRLMLYIPQPPQPHPHPPKRHQRLTFSQVLLVATKSSRSLLTHVKEGTQDSHLPSSSYHKTCYPPPPYHGIW